MPPTAAPWTNLRELETAAEARIDPGAFGYIAGGAEDEATLHGNTAAFARWRLRPRVLRDVSKASAATTVLGTPVSLPALVAPTAYHGLLHPAGEAATAQGAAEAGTVFTLSTLANRDLESVARAAKGPKWFQLYVFRDRDLTVDVVRRVEQAGYSALVLTVDLPVSGRRERDLRSGFTLPQGLGLGHFAGLGQGQAPHEVVASQIDPSLTWEDVAWLRAETRMPLLVKGILDPRDAVRAVDVGAAGVVVSNHGGRQLDHAVPAVAALPDVVAAVDGQAEVLVDGGVRRGTDILKALALGARAVLVGRPVLYGLALEGASGVARVLGHLRQEVETSLSLLGAATVDEVAREHLVTWP